MLVVDGHKKSNKNIAYSHKLLQTNRLLLMWKEHTALHKLGGAHQTSNHLPKPNL